MSEQIGKTDYILLRHIICSGEEMAQIMRKDLLLWNTGSAAEAFHVAPDVRAVELCSASADEHRPREDAALFTILGQHLAQLSRKKGETKLAL